MKLWFDFTNPPHVNFYYPLIQHYSQPENSVLITAREFVETVKLAEVKGLHPKVLGKHGGKNRVSKLYSLLSREMLLLNQISDFDVSLSSNYEAPLASWLKRKMSLVFDDNDISPNWLYSKFASFVISPEFIDREAMYRMGIKKEQLITYPGFKENIYAAGYEPDPSFLDNLPFKEFVTVRPENLQASYVPDGAVSIVPELIDKLVKSGFNVLYLPRYAADKAYYNENKQVFIPPAPLNGLDVCYYSNAVLTGAGTFSREAAVMGTPSVSFFSGKTFLGVDKQMFSEKMVLHSRDSDEIVRFVRTSSKKGFDQQKSLAVQQELFGVVDTLLSKI
ncbi:MAG: DUF354 domain-containing protein [Bacteroidota bacterium]|nr:MAG: DUF354 domain-containing protein [Bacteroidota bacterium]